MPAPAGLLRLAAALALAAGAQAGGGTARTEHALPYSSSDIVHPIKVDESGSFLSYDLSHRVLHRRSPSSRSKFLAFYELHYKGQPLRFNLSLNNNLLAPGFVSERRYGGIATAKIQSHTYNSCHMIGEVQSRALTGGLAALSTCDGLKGVFQLMNEDYFIEPVPTSLREDGAAQPHRIYKRQAPEPRAEPGRSPPAPRETCGVRESQESLERSEKRRERWEQKQHRKRRIKQRSISKEKWVETLVVADTKMIEYHGSENIEKYVLTVMNMVAGLFHHASIGNPINIAIVRLILLEDEEEDLKISHHADNTLKSFCKWQKSINVKGDSHPLHHDVAVLLTRKDICAAMNRPCETLGLSHVAGMCQPHRSCNINEDTGLPLAFTVAHELGHSSCMTRPHSPGPAAAGSTSHDSSSYVDIGIIPVGAREIRIEEVAEAGNFLALRSEDPEKYFLNGGWTIQWNGDYRVAGTTFTYKRTGNWENLTSPGPTVEPVWIQLLFQETNPGVRYQYTIQRPADSENEIEQAEFLWRFGSWTTCTATCGTGVQRQIVHCVEKLAGIVEERYCDALTRPDDQQRTCSEEPCPARWWVGEWQKCSATCGPSGLMRRTVLCIQSVGLDEQRALQQADCQHLPKPDAAAPCHQEVPCPSQWTVGNWSECSMTCGNGTQRRPVYCSNSTGAACDPAERPSSETICSLPQCQKKLDNTNTDWSGSGSSSREIFNEIHYIPSNHIAKFNPLIPSIPESNDVNIITEEDFSARKGNVFVDDFYYDYNFINFHEDLSYYPFTEKETKGEEPKPELSTNNVEGSRELPADVLHTAMPGGAASEDHLVTSEANTFPPVHGEGETEPGGLAMNDLRSVVPEDAGTAAPKYAIPDFTGEEEDAMLVPRSEDHLPTWSTTSHDSANSHDHPPPDEPWGAVPTRTGPGQDAPAHGLAPRAPYPADPPPPLPAGRGSAGADASDSLGELGSSGEGRTSTEGPGNAGSEEHDVASSAGRGREDSREMGLVITSSANSAAPETEEQEGWAEMPAPERTVGTHTAPAADEQVHGTERADLFFPTPQGPAWEMGRSAGSTHPAASPYPAGVDGGPAGQAGHQPEPRTPTSLSSTALVATTAFPAAVSSSPAVPGPATQLTSSGLTQQDALVPAVPTAPAHSPPTHPAGASPSLSPWTMGVSHHPEPASPRAQQTSRGAVLGSTVPGQRSPWAAPGTFAFSDGEHELSQPTPAPPPLWEKEETEKEEALLPPSTTTAALPSWEVGNWSECSATCGVGAIWRTVRCSTGSDDGCAAANKPVPARRCSLRPCSSWRVGNWSKCSRSCGGGMKVRDVHCIDTRDQRLLRPFHCQAVLYKPPAQLPCQSTPCLAWYTSSWRECSESCGGGEQERLVTCPELGRCEEALRPNATRPCNTHPCTTWVVGSWGECTAPCGGGIQRRQVKCINTKTGLAEEDSSLCDHEPWPESTQKCNPQDCESSESGFVCERDRLTFGFCQTLRVLGRCHLPTVHLQCCRSCRQHGHRAAPDRDRGDERASRR
ncbi:A disintegrin and metalloproteinase with thrombospondin motifs 7 isoform X2 [Balearica regulorum gibbericeps]|uniref:A disintegrin and metalloproteinase with thrombospondin motifs 7 isoform X2 n=1 Tax=Balearica regulorum gibbericeps TaxID=100784 RepID=UPI003F63151E